ncbi:hypothetical protein RSAG8_13640, partial [Rhizoctonia solani AG-8 WAC10335]
MPVISQNKPMAESSGLEAGPSASIRILLDPDHAKSLLHAAAIRKYKIRPDSEQPT